MSDHVLEITEASDWQECLDSNASVVVRFTAEWCQPCKKFKPAFDAAAARMPETTFVVIDIDKSPWAVVDYGIQGIPKVMVFRDGRYVDDVARTNATRTPIKFLEELQNI